MSVIILYVILAIAVVLAAVMLVRNDRDHARRTSNDPGRKEDLERRAAQKRREGRSPHSSE